MFRAFGSNLFHDLTQYCSLPFVGRTADGVFHETVEYIHFVPYGSEIGHGAFRVPHPRADSAFLQCERIFAVNAFIEMLRVFVILHRDGHPILLMQVGLCKHLVERAGD
ncbi:hypothetical protein BSAE_1783 [Bifidobacterium pullorum subsp. saeculare DSM 6531 = LMG 14934]|uniref:Uncharacterized protein n=1 Tax=Bifidobacterium pullorum subsp. saeculare DSM 6531 = LMG 14934 TaxID=1437611 RepID=A0A087CXZ6_9BIFI|nr:hypothetical protein BSAE_1783 [Bifidobacterium pullorum subsp. saeculare DSM 6531 = LMG 14934]